MCKYLKHLFTRQVSYNRFVELKKEVLLSLSIFIKKVLPETCIGSSFVDSTSLRVCRNQRMYRVAYKGFFKILGITFDSILN